MTGPFGFSGDAVRGVRYLGRHFDAWVDFDAEEIARRGRYGLVAVTDRGTLEALASLPLAVPIRKDEIAALALAALDAGSPVIAGAGRGLRHPVLAPSPQSERGRGGVVVALQRNTPG